MSTRERDELRAQLALEPGACRDEIAKTFLSVPWEPDHEWLYAHEVHWQRPTDFESLLSFVPSPSVTRIDFIRSGLEGKIIGYREKVEVQTHDAGSMQRPLGDITSFVRGSTSQSPFVPGGMDAPDEERELPADGFRTVPPGFSRGLDADGRDEHTPAATVSASGDAGDHTHIIADDALYRMSNTAPVMRDGDAFLDEILPAETVPSVFADEAAPSEPKRTWAHVIDASRQMTNFHELVPQMAIEYPFELDTFQKQAVYHLEQSDSVFVAAHTSAGKTVVAEYAIALAMKHLSRCIYTSPIKALSNQKYREFKQKFGANNVGILTGDVQINAEAPCLIMTTEILRSMLYRGADLIRDVEFVVFDEVHYVNDQERGVVWEEVIILLPAHINIVLLSATVPNYREFADWVGRTKKKDVYVVSTTKRPVPLEHFLYAGKDIIRVVDERGQFLARGVHQAADALTRKQDRDAPATRGRGNARGRGGASGPRRHDVASDRSLWVHLIGTLKKKALLPVVVFVFSKRKCQEYADSLSSTDLSTAQAKSEVHVIMERSLTRLKEADRNLPQIVQVRDMLLRGIGIHHSGLLPIMKEVVEIMFQRGLVKVLFATETFAMGVNMPARSVVFSSIRKHDGHSMRNLLPGEYTQMSGRAGRRGLDKTGVVVVIASDESTDVHMLNRMMLGQSTKLRSQFRITYSMVLNLLRVETLRVEDMIKRSFSENSTQILLPAQQEQLANVEKDIATAEKQLASCSLGADALAALHDDMYGVLRTNSTMLAIAFHHSQGARIFSPGRFVFLRDSSHTWTPALIIRASSAHRILLLTGRTESDTNTRAPLWLTAPRVRQFEPAKLTAALRALPLSSIVFITRHSTDIDQSKLEAKHAGATRHALDAMKRIFGDIKEDLLRSGDVVRATLAHEADWERVRRLDFSEAQQERAQLLEHAASAQELLERPSSVHEFAVVTRLRRSERDAARIRASMSEQNLELLPDYHQRMEVLRALRFVDPDSDSVLLKGRVACEIKSVAELVLTELLLDNFFREYAPEEVVALLSVLVFREKSQVEPELSERLAHGVRRIADTTDRIAAVQVAHQVAFDEDAESLRTGLVEVVYEWARGTDFYKIMELTDVGEGTIVRAMTRLDETLRNLRDAARVMGDMELYSKMQHCQSLIRRDIVFAASLYF